QELGNRLARKIWIEGPYIALHLRLEKNVWVKSGCLTGLGPEYDEILIKVRESQPEYLTGRLLKALGASSSARIYIARGEPFGCTQALQPLAAEFPNLVSREMLAQEGELSPYINKSSALAAIDYIVSLSSNVFVPYHGGNMGRIMQLWSGFGPSGTSLFEPSKRSPGAEEAAARLWRRLGPDGGTGILLLGTKTVPLCDRAAAGGTTGFESRTAKAPPRDDVTRKIRISTAAPRILALSILQDGAAGIKGPRLYAAAEAESGWKRRFSGLTRAEPTTICNRRARAPALLASRYCVKARTARYKGGGRA
ncbi:hypothetical protein CJ030_MR3G018701, partial [Morella rubra]